MKKTLWLIPLFLFISLCLMIAYTETRNRPSTVTTVVTSTTASSDTTALATTETTATTTYTVNYNLNTAAPQDLMTINGIGERLAERILTLRAEKNGFTSREELLEVEGIGDTLLARIMERFYIENEIVTTEDITTTAATSTEKTQSQNDTTTASVFMKFELNTVTAAELCTVAGITPALADEIITFRTEIGGFSHTYELCLIGNKSTDWWAERLDYFYVEDCIDPVATNHTTAAD